MSKRGAPTRCRRTPAESIPPSPHLCQLCGCEMGFDVNTFACYSAMDGPYAKVYVRLKCSNEACRFLDSRRTTTRDPAVLAVLWEHVNALGDATHAPGLPHPASMSAHTQTSRRVKT